MGKYHVNLADVAVLKRVVMALAEPKKEVEFNITKANKKFLLKIIDPAEVASYKEKEIRSVGEKVYFFIEEVT